MEPTRHAIVYRQIRAYLAAGRPDFPQRWVLPSVTGRAGLEISVIASRDGRASTACWLAARESSQCWHLSLCAVGPTYTDLPDVDLDAVTRGVFGAELEKAWTMPPAPLFDADRDAPASPYTTHVRVFLDRRGRPMRPRGDVRHLDPWVDGANPLLVRPS